MNGRMLRLPYFFVVILVLFPLAGFAQGTAELFSLQGQVEILTAPSTWSPIAQGAKLPPGSTIRTKDQSRAAIVLGDGVLIRLNENSEFTIESHADESSRGVALAQGEAYFLSRKPKRFPFVTTPTVSAAVRGTEFVVRASAASTTVSLLHGAVLCQNQRGSVDLASGEEAIAKRGEAPTKRVIVDLIGTVQWAFYYPPLFSNEGNSKLLELGRLLSSGQIEEVAVLLSQIESDPDYLSRKDSQLVAGYYAARSLLALSRNDKDQARIMAQKAEDSEPASPAALSAVSLAAQANLDLDTALSRVVQLLTHTPNSAFAHARKAELLLAQGDVDGAVASAEQALALEGSDPYALSVLGFTKLVRYETDEAVALFERAISQQHASGLFHFGLGLARIRQGDLEAGRIEISKAAALEPGLAIYRSYLGKAYFEEDKEDLARNEYERALALDPEDPTAYLYRAYSNLSANRVVEALSDVEASISRNDNRAIYRSRMLLDKDNAVRSAGLAEVFNSLGFDRAAQVEAIKSINRDYSNYAAHRLLSESYTTVNLADSAISESKLTTVLSPLSLNLFNNVGTAAGLNEYNALFERPEHRTNVQFSGSTLDDMLAPELFQSGRTEQFGYFFGLEPNFRDGSHDNDDFRFYRVRGAAQYQLSYQDRIILEALYSSNEEENSHSTFSETDFEDDAFDLSYHREVSPSSGFIAQAAYRKSRAKFRRFDNRPFDLFVTSGGAVSPFNTHFVVEELARDDLEDLRLSTQYYHESELFSAVLGGEYFMGSPDRRETTLLIDDDFSLFPDLERTIRSASAPNIDSQTAYLYTTWHLAAWVDLILGGNYVHLETELTELAPFVEGVDSRSQWNPKVGLTFYPTADMLVRTAYFESLRGSSLEDFGSIEPTLVGGLNQNFTDLSGTRSRNYSAGVDYKLPSKTYLGVEGVHRDVIDSANIIFSNYSIDFDALTESYDPFLLEEVESHLDVDLASAYVYQVISEQFVGSLDYAFTLFENTNPLTPILLRTHRISPTLRYFHPRGWFSFVRGSWWNQDHEKSFLFEEQGSNAFWLVDAGIGYRLPNRHGSVALELSNILDENFQIDQAFGLFDPIAPDFSAKLLLNINF